jgi:hypothetical protein
VRPRVLLVTDLAYEAKGRRYGDEDVRLSTRLREHFDLALCHPLDAAALMDAFDVVLIRNSGPVIHYREAHDAFRARALAAGTRVFPELTGRADMAGKRYLLDLSADGWPVVPSAADLEGALRLPPGPDYVVKPMFGADSVGLRVVSREGLAGLVYDDVLVQPRIDFEHEVSFYFVDRTLEYALHAPDPERRWQLQPYRPTAADREFAQSFVDWNSIRHGIQRVDACRTRDGDLLLMELEDLNPYLSLDLVGNDETTALVDDLVTSLAALAAGR